MREHADHLRPKVWQAASVPNALIGLLAVVLAVVLRWRRRARRPGESDGEQQAAQQESHPESLTRAEAVTTAYGTIEHVTPMPAPSTSPGAGAPSADSGGVPAPVNPELAAAVETARAAAEEEARPGADPIGSPVLTMDTAGSDPVGAHVGVEPEGPNAATHYFESNYPGYVGWRWAVTVAHPGPGEPVTVSEVVLLPGPDALTAPEWVPWSERVRPGDLGAGDLLPPREDDPRLVPGYLAGDDPAVEEVSREIGLGRKRVLSHQGRLEAAGRWQAGDFGPRSEMARMAPATCGTCGFFVKLAGSMGAAFGVCANEVAPADGRVVSVEFGCGAHSEVEVDTSSTVPVAEVVYDDATLDYEPRSPERG
ncbi:hypothetical protein GCM10025787_39340 [Saccharopolyspora rosea]